MMIIYQLKVGLCLIAFYLVWKLLLSRETLHRFNRVVILATVLLSLVLPWVKFSTSQPTPVAEVVMSLEDVVTITPDSPVTAPTWHLTLHDVLFYISIIGAVAVFIWIVYGQFRVLKMIGKGECRVGKDGVKVHVFSGDVAPFSFFNHIVISQQDYNENAEAILAHERAHIRLGHSYELMAMNVLLLFQWWNPAAWLLRRELKQVHEYEADEAVLKRGVDARQYQLLLIRKSVGDQLFSMANSFNYQSLKKRIRMMTTKRSSRWQQLRVLAVVPVAALALVAYAHPEVNDLTEQMDQTAIQPEMMAEQIYAVPADTSKVFDVVEQMPDFPGGMEALMQYLKENIKYPKDAEQQQKQGRVLVTFVVEKDGSVTEPKVVKSVFSSLDEEALRVIKNMPRWTPGKQKGKPVRVKYTIPISFRLQGEKEKAIYFIENVQSQNAEPLIIIDGKEVTKADVEALDQSKIDAITVLRGVAGSQVYGDKGKNGVVEIKLKK